MRTSIAWTGALALSLVAAAHGQSVLFDFNSTPYFTPLPLDVTAGGITAHLAGTGQGFSIQQAGAFGFTPAGFSGNCIMPNSVYAADLVIGFSTVLAECSIMFSTQELECDTAATMKATAYLNGSLVGSSTAQAAPPGTWPTGTLAVSAAQGFNSVVVHYQSAPPGCSDYGVIFMADNLIVTPKGAAPCVGDLDANGHVDGADLGALLAEWGGGGAADLDGDGVVGGADLGLVLGHWGACP